jgi:nucleoside 2-deoxyribosyltransferase
MSLTNVSHVFLAAPYTQWLDPETGVVGGEHISSLSALREALLTDGVAVFSAHHNEDWGRAWLPAEVCTPADYLAIDKADVVCAVLGAPASPGVLIELGWASALRKPLVLVVEDEPPQLVRGLGRLTDVTTMTATAPLKSADIERVVGAVRHAAGKERVAHITHVAEYPLTPLPYGYHLAPT